MLRTVAIYKFFVVDAPTFSAVMGATIDKADVNDAKTGLYLLM